MRILDDILGTLTGDAAVDELRFGARNTAVRSRRLGLAYAYDVSSGPEPSVDPLAAGGSARALATLATSDVLAVASAGVAAVNSLLEPPRRGLEEVNALELVARRGEGKRITFVGHFPFAERLRDRVEALWILEQRPQEGDLPASAAERVIPLSDVVAITGATLVNHTLGPLLELARGCFVVVLGPTTPLTPVLFDYGVDALGGVVIDEAADTLERVRRGERFRDVPGLRYVLWQRDAIA